MATRLMHVKCIRTLQPCTGLNHGVEIIGEPAFPGYPRHCLVKPVKHWNLIPSQRRVNVSRPRHREEGVRGIRAETPGSAEAATAPPAQLRLADPVLVLGATGGVGQIVTSALLDRGYKVRALMRSIDKGKACFGEAYKDQLQMFVGDTRFAETLTPELMEGVKSVICCTGTTAFPSKRWDGGNKPEAIEAGEDEVRLPPLRLSGYCKYCFCQRKLSSVDRIYCGTDTTVNSKLPDYHGVKNLVAAVPPTVQHFVLVSSVGCDSYNSFPYNILNLFGVLKWKKAGEEVLKASGIPYTILRPGRLTDGPYTSYDINTLLKATRGTRRAVIVSQGDKLKGECSRISIAEACIQALALPSALGQTYELNSIEGEGPDADQEKWEVLFTSAQHHST